MSFELAKEQFQSQYDRQVAIDGKASFSLGSATTVISTALVIQGVLLSLHAFPFSYKIIQFIFLLALLISYIAAIITGWHGYKIRSYQYVPEPRILLDEWVDKVEEETKGAIFATMVNVIEHNQLIITNKSKWIDRSLLYLIIETIIFVSLLIIQIIYSQFLF